MIKEWNEQEQKPLKIIEITLKIMSNVKDNNETM
jgi:hypothetical protein